MNTASWMIWITLLIGVFLTPAVIVSCSNRTQGNRKQRWVVMTLVLSWVGFLGYLNATDRDFFD